MRSLFSSSIFRLPVTLLRLRGSVPGCALVVAIGCSLLVSDGVFGQGVPQDAVPSNANTVSAGGSEIARNYSAARSAFDAHNWSEASQRFRDVSRACPNSPLSLQCDYFDILAQWNRQPSVDLAEKLSVWLITAQAFQEKHQTNQKLIETYDDWIENTQLILARFERASNRLDEAEYRLRRLLKFQPEKVRTVGTDPALAGQSLELIAKTALPSRGCQAANAWNELAQLLQSGRNNMPEARVCYENSATHCEHNSSCLPVALWGMASCCIAEKDLSHAREYVDRLSDMKINDEWTIRVAVLKTNLLRAISQSESDRSQVQLSEINRILEPVAVLALSSNPPALALYELAMALVESGDQVQSDQLMLHLLQLHPATPFAIEARVRLAHSSVTQGDEGRAKALLDEAIELGCPASLASHAHLLRGTLLMNLGQAENAKADFEIALQACHADIPIEVSIRFQLSESLYQLKLWNQGKEQWRWLLDFAEQHPESKSSMAWLPVVMLRQAEMLAFQRSWKDAESMVYKIREDFPECSSRYEVDYLLARCFISDARFEDARKTLRTLAQGDSAVPKELVARSRWMTGESFVMQQRYETAIEAYRHVLSLPGSSYWHSSALLQIGQCCEALGDVSGARDAYNQFLTQYAQSPLANNARERLQSLPTAPSLANQPGRATTGTKR